MISGRLKEGAAGLARLQGGVPLKIIFLPQCLTEACFFSIHSLNFLSRMSIGKNVLGLEEVCNNLFMIIRNDFQRVSLVKKRIGLTKMFLKIRHVKMVRLVFQKLITI